MSNEAKKIGKNAALALLSQVPVVSAFSKFFEDFVQDNWQERIDLWKEEVVKRLAQLDTKMEQKIKETSNFANILASAQRGALEDIEEDKVALYANAVINAIKNENIDDTKKHIFLNMLRDFTVLHVETLKFFNHPNQRAAGFQNHVSLGMRSTYDVIVELNNTIDGGEDVLDAVMQDLKTKSMLTIGRMDNIQMSFGIPKLTTSLADEFLAFIAEQENNDD